MKKSILAILLSAIILLSGCAREIPILDASQSNVVSDLLYNPIMETDIGFYYNGRTNGGMQVQYVDKATGTNIFLCTKPECQHDGSSYCTATSMRLSPLYMTMYDEIIYIAGFRYEGDYIYFDLYQLTNNGSELTQLVEYFNIQSAGVILNSSNGGLTIHRGKAYVTYNLFNNTTRTDNPEGGFTLAPNDKDGISGIVEIDLATLKYKTIEEVGKLETGTHTDVRAVGDYIYYMLATTGKPDYLKRYNIYDGTFEQLPVNPMIKSYSVVGDDVIYNYADSTVKRYNTLTGETTDFVWDKVIVDGKKEVDKDGNVTLSNKSLLARQIVYDGEYLYICHSGLFTGRQEFTTNGYYQYETDIEIYIYNLNGERVGEIIRPWEILEWPSGFVEEARYRDYSFHILNGKVYYQGYKKVESCPLQDILDGNAVWTLEYEKNVRTDLPEADAWLN